MTHYAMLLNLDEANAHSLRRDELFHHILQGSILRKILLGHGQTEYTAMKNSLDAILEGNTSGREAFRHLWLHDEESESMPILHTLPGHEFAMQFCRKYSLPGEAETELSSFFNILFKNNEQ